MSSGKPANRKLPEEALALLGLTAKQAGSFAPGSVNTMETKLGPIWLKVLGVKTSHPLRSMLRRLIDLLPAPALAKTPSGKGGDTLLRQVEQADILRRSGFHTPETIFANHDFYITADAGKTLARIRSDLDAVEHPATHEVEAFRTIVLAASHELARLHRAGLAHGRPKMRDFAWHPDGEDGGAVVMFDLEERPWETMAMADAQARDIMLWVVDLCSFGRTRDFAQQAGKILCDTAAPEVTVSLRQVVRTMGPFAPFARLLARTRFASREIRGGLAAYNIFKQRLIEDAPSP